MRTPLLDSTNKVVNVVIAGSGWQPPDGLIAGAPGGEIGDTWGGSGYVKPPANTLDLMVAVDQERDRRIAAGVTFDGKVYQSDNASKQRLLGVCLQATLAIMNGAQANNMRWADPDNDFTYISADNTAVVMDAPTTIALGQVVAGHEKAMIYKARALKDREGGPPADYADDSHWT